MSAAASIPLSSWIMATRPKTLVAGAVPVLVGAAAGAHGGHLWLAPLCLICSILIQIGTNLFNDVYDFIPKHIEEQRRELKDHLKIYGKEYDLDQYKDGEKYANS